MVSAAKHRALPMMATAVTSSSVVEAIGEMAMEGRATVVGVYVLMIATELGHGSELLTTRNSSGPADGNNAPIRRMETTRQFHNGGRSFKMNSANNLTLT